MFRLYLYDGMRSTSASAPDLTSVAAAITTAMQDKNPPEVITVVYNDRRVGQVRLWQDDGRIYWTDEMVKDAVSGMMALWPQSPASKPRGSHGGARKKRMQAVLDRYDMNHNRNELERDIWEAVK